MPLKLKLKPDEKIIVNGAVVACGSKPGEMVFFNRARILREEAVLGAERMRESVLSVDGRRNDVWFYYLIQLIYIEPELAEKYMNQLADTVSLLREEFPGKDWEINNILGLMADGRFYDALKACRKAFPGCLSPNGIKVADEYDEHEENRTMTTPAQAYVHQPDPNDPRAVEAWGLMQAAQRLDDARRDPGNEEVLRESLRKNQLLWTILQSAVGDRETPLSDEVRNNILSLSYMVDRKTFDCLGDLDGEKVDFLVDLNRNIAMGLMGHPEPEGARTP